MRNELLAFVGRLYLHRDSIEVIGKNYFDGRPILFPDIAKRLEQMIRQSEIIVKEYNNFMRAWLAIHQNDAILRAEMLKANGLSLEDFLLDLSAVSDSARSSVRREVAFTIRMVKGESITMLGMQEEGRRLAVEAYNAHFG